MHPYPGNFVAIRRAVVYYDRTVHAFSAGIECWYCSYIGDMYSICCYVVGTSITFSILVDTCRVINL